MTDHSADGTGLYWAPTEHVPSIFNLIPSNDGCWEVEPGSLAEKVVTGTSEYKDAHRACMDYLTSGEPYGSNMELHRQFGSEAAYRNSLEGAADDYATRAVANDNWRCGGVVYPYVEGSAQLSMPIRERIAAEASRTATPAAQPDATTRDLTAYTPVNEPAYGGRSL
jgi:hypothetical protein